MNELVLDLQAELAAIETESIGWLPREDGCRVQKFPAN